MIAIALVSYGFANLESSRDAPTGASPAKNRARTARSLWRQRPPRGASRARTMAPGVQ